MTLAQYDYCVKRLLATGLLHKMSFGRATFGRKKPVYFKGGKPVFRFLSAEVSCLGTKRSLKDQPFFRANSRMKSHKATTPSRGMAL